MGTIAVLIAEGANDFMLPCRIFTDMASGRESCDRIFGIAGVAGEDFEDRVVYRADLDSEKDPWPISDELFAGWYYGCGAPYRFILKEVDFDTKFIRYDLD